MLEVLIASMIFASVIGGVAAAWTLHEQSLRKFRNRNAARLFLSQEMALLLAQTYPNLEDAARNTSFSLIREIDGVPASKDFVLTTTVTEDTTRHLKDVLLSISYEERNETRQLSLRSRVFRSE